MNRYMLVALSMILAISMLGCSRKRPAPSATRTVEIVIRSDAQYVWCEGGMVAKDDYRTAEQAAWAPGEHGVWRELDCDTFGSDFRRCAVVTPIGFSFRFQCYLRNKDPAADAVLIRSLCSQPGQTKEGESMFVSVPYGLVASDPKQGSYVCQTY